MDLIKVLLVDDEVEFLELLEKRLGKRQIAVRCATSGEEAIEIVRTDPPDVVVLDVKMPNMDGLEALRRIKAISPQLEVIMLTGHANLEAASRGMELGAFDFMVKPVTINELLTKLVDAYRNKQMRARRN